MKIWMLTGGVRSGKSRHAVELARELGGDDVAFVATARPEDDEMERRIRDHREERPASWETFEPPTPPEHALRDSGRTVVILDCLTLMVSDAVASAGSEDEALEAVAERVDLLLDAARERAGRLIVVTNEVGLGVVPAHPEGRWFRDALGTANQQIAAVADRVVLMVSGLPVRLRRPNSRPGGKRSSTPPEARES